MRNTIICLILAYCLLPTADSFSQVKIIKATSQKTFRGIGGVLINYSVEIKSKGNKKIEIDSVKTIADTSVIKFYFKKNESLTLTLSKGEGAIQTYKITFGQLLVKAEKCKTCRDADSKTVDFTKGVIIYYKSNDKKHFFKATKFEQLPDVKAP